MEEQEKQILNDLDKSLDFLADGRYSTTFYVAGVQHRPDWQDMLEELYEEQVLQLEPEPTNKYDPNAVKIMAPFETGLVRFLGYVPSKNGPAPVIASLIGKGINLRATILEVNEDAKPWKAIGVLIEEVGH